MPKTNDLVTKEYFDLKFNQIDEKFRDLDKRFRDIHKRVESTDKKLDYIAEKMDWIVGEYRKHDEEHTLLNGKASEHSDRLEVVEEKLGIQV